jgi:dual specificity protein kinase YAK1
VAQERSLREALVDFLLGVLDLDPQTRWTPRQALQHPFITGGIFQVPAPPRSTDLSLTC